MPINFPTYVQSTSGDALQAVGELTRPIVNSGTDLNTVVDGGWHHAMGSYTNGPSGKTGDAMLAVFTSTASGARKYQFIIYPDGSLYGRQSNATGTSFSGSTWAQQSGGSGDAIAITSGGNIAVATATTWDDKVVFFVGSSNTRLNMPDTGSDMVFTVRNMSPNGSTLTLGVHGGVGVTQARMLTVGQAGHGTLDTSLDLWTYSTLAAGVHAGEIGTTQLADSSVTNAKLERAHRFLSAGGAIGASEAAGLDKSTIFFTANAASTVNLASIASGSRSEFTIHNVSPNKSALTVTHATGSASNGPRTVNFGALIRCQWSTSQWVFTVETYGSTSGQSGGGTNIEYSPVGSRLSFRRAATGTTWTAYTSSTPRGIPVSNNGTHLDIDIFVPADAFTVGNVVEWQYSLDRGSTWHPFRDDSGDPDRYTASSTSSFTFSRRLPREAMSEADASWGWNETHTAFVRAVRHSGTADFTGTLTVYYQSVDDSKTTRTFLDTLYDTDTSVSASTVASNGSGLNTTHFGIKETEEEKLLEIILHVSLASRADYAGLRITRDMIDATGTFSTRPSNFNSTRSFIAFTWDPESNGDRFIFPVLKPHPVQIWRTRNDTDGDALNKLLVGLTKDGIYLNTISLCALGSSMTIRKIYAFRER